MGKKCIICGEEAKYSIKGTSDHYCEECAIENFGDISMLLKVEEEAKKLKKMIEEADEDVTKLNEELDDAVSIIEKKS